MFGKDMEKRNRRYVAQLARDKRVKDLHSRLHREDRGGGFGRAMTMAMLVGGGVALYMNRERIREMWPGARDMLNKMTERASSMRESWTGGSSYNGGSQSSSTMQGATGAEVAHQTTGMQE
jgi:hypothetical protein